MGLLTAGQLAAIPGGKFRQKWTIIHADGLISFVLHDDDGGPQTVIDPGSRTASAYNVSLQSPGDLAAQTYQFTASNASGQLYHTGTGSYFYDVSKTAWVPPTTAVVKHQVYVWASGAWSELPCSPWVGRIAHIEYDDVLGPDGTWGPGTATVTCEGYLGELVRKPWTNEHGEHVENATAITPSGFLVYSFSSGWDMVGSDYRLWVQYRTTVTSSSSVKFYANSGIWSTGIASTSSVTLHQMSIILTAPNFWTSATANGTIASGGYLPVAVNYPDIPKINRSDGQTARPWV